MNLAIMQPYFLPYVGYFQLVSAVDHFVFYDDAQFIKNGWIERNRYLLDGQAKWFGVPLAKGRHDARINERHVSASFSREIVLNKLAFAYRNAPFRVWGLDLVEDLLSQVGPDIARFNGRVLQRLCSILELNTRFSWASDLVFDDACRGESRVIAIASALGASTYINPVGGMHLYDQRRFNDHGLELRFISPRLHEYRQFAGDFVPALSILDLLMFNSVEQVSDWAASTFVEAVR